MANPNHPTRAETPMAFIRAMVEAYTQRGLDPSSALRKAQITPSQLKSTNARVTTLQMEWMSEAAMRELDDEALGWFRRRLPWGSYGMLVRASLTAPTLGVAMQRWCRHHNLLTDDIALHLTADKHTASLALHEQHDLGTMREFCTVSVLRNALGVASWLTDSRIDLSQTELHFAAPPHQASYRVLFDGPTRFDAPLSRISFDAGYLQLPVRRDEAALQRMLQRALLLTVRPYRRDRLLVEKVRHALAEHPQATRNAEDLAALLHPTAAVAGTPTVEAQKLISELEPFDRGRYAGPVGWIGADGDGEWAIALRGALLSENQLTAFAGCGIVAESDADAELDETELKFKPIREALA